MGDLQKALIAAYDDPTPTKPGIKQLIGTADTPSRFTPEAVADTILSHIGEDNLRAKVCTELLTRLRLTCTTDGATYCTEMPHCPAESVVEKCPP
jgi:hypothetical protein